MEKKSLIKIQFLLLVTLFIASCSTNTGKYYDNDGAPSSWQSFRISTEDAVPKIEKTVAATSRPYTVMGKKYYPMSGDKPFVQTGVASWYGKQFHGKKTSTGETYNMYEMTAAHPTMELPSYARVTNLENGKSVIVRFNDRGPFLRGRIADMSYAAATKLGYVDKGTAKVKIERITRAQIAAGTWDKGSNGKELAVSHPEVATVVKKVVSTAVKPSSVKITKLPEEDIIRELATQKIGQMVTSSMEPKQKEIKEVINTQPAEFSVAAVDKNKFAEGVYAMSDGSSLKENTKIRSETVKVAEEKPVTPPKVVSPAGVGFCVQLGAFKSEDNANKLLEKAKNSLGSDADMVRLVNAHGFHKVVVGENLTRQRAYELSKSIQKAMGSKPAIIKEDQL